MPADVEVLELPFDGPALAVPAPVGTVVAPPGPTPTPDVPVCTISRDPLGVFPCCPMCGGEMRPEHAHYRCACGWRDSCCD